MVVTLGVCNFKQLALERWKLVERKRKTSTKTGRMLATGSKQADNMVHQSWFSRRNWYICSKRVWAWYQKRIRFKAKQTFSEVPKLQVRCVTLAFSISACGRLSLVFTVYSSTSSPLILELPVFALQAMLFSFCLSRSSCLMSGILSSPKDLQMEKKNWGADCEGVGTSAASVDKEVNPQTVILSHLPPRLFDNSIHFNLFFFNTP